MSTNRARINVILRSGNTISSPVQDRAKADEDFTAISAARESGENLKLAWLSVTGGEIEAAHIEELNPPRKAHFG
jgi:hypothetical protein